MKEWTQHQARSNQLVEAEQFNAEQSSARGQIAALDRAQYPVDVVTDARLTDHATHIVVVHNLWAAGAGLTDTEGEQTNVRASAANSNGDQFRAITYQLYGGAWKTAFSYSVEPFKGGSLQTEWFGNICCFQYFFISAKRNNHPLDSKPITRKVEMRILHNGVVVASRYGVGRPMDHFRIVGEAQAPAGPVEVQCQWRLTGPGPDDATTESQLSGGARVDGAHLTQGHLFSNRVVSIGRWR
jgi:hypothetical protein